jgi:uncharacterized membrane protein
MTLASPPRASIAPASGRAIRLLPAILILGIALRLWGLDAQSFTMDEITELEISRTSFAGAITAADGLPPLYSVLLHAWLRVGGTPDNARWLSLIIGVVTLPAMYRLGRQHGGQTVGIFSALLLAIAPLHVWYSQELRSYGLLVLLAVLSLWRFDVARRSDRLLDWIWYALPTVAGFYTHYYYALVPLSLGVAELAQPVAGTRRVGRFLQVHAAIAVTVLPLMLLLLPADLAIQLNWPDEGRPLDAHALAYTIFTFLTGYSVGPSLRELHTARPTEAIAEVLPWAVIAGSAAAYLSYVGYREAGASRDWRRLLLLLAAPFPVCWILAETLEVGYRVRYVVWALAPLLVLLAYGLAAARTRRHAWVAFAVLAAVSAVALVNRAVLPRYQNEDVHSAARQLEALTDPDDPIFVISGYMADPVRYYLDGRRTLQPLYSPETVAAPDSGLRRIRGSVLPGHRFWLVYSRPFHGDPGGRIREHLSQHAALELRASLAGVELFEGRGW